MSPHPHDALIEGYRPGCEFPEAADVGLLDWVPNCRDCLAALIGFAVNRPDYVLVNDDDTRSPAAPAALRQLRKALPDHDPLRVRAEQALLPLIGAAS